MSGLKMTPERIVREYRNERLTIDEGRWTKKNPPGTIAEKIIKVFLWIVLGWGAGYLHHWLAMSMDGRW